MVEKINIIQNNRHDSLKYLFSKLNEYLEKNTINKIITNGNLASILQDDMFILTDSSKNKYYKVGNYNGVELIIDRLQLWTDNKIEFKNNKKTVITVYIIDKNDMLI